MKKTYIKPKIEAVVTIGPRLMLSGSNTVNEFEYNSEDPINIGDTDTP